MRAEGLKASPLGILMHPEYGLWHAYRGALLFDEALAAEDLNQEPENPIHLCALCDRKPCLDACPVGGVREPVRSRRVWITYRLGKWAHVHGRRLSGAPMRVRMVRGATPRADAGFPDAGRFRGAITGGD